MAAEPTMSKEAPTLADFNGGPATRQMTSETIPIPKEVFESMYLNPEARVKGQLRKILANPTPMPLMGFLISSSTLGCTLMGWRGAGGNGAALVGNLFMFGGTLQLLGAIMEWILGNGFIFVVFGCYGAFWITMSITLVPYFNAEGAYTDGLSGAALIAGKEEYYATFAFFFLFMGLINFYFTICSLRTNVILVIVFFFIELALLLLAGAYWLLAEGRDAVAANVQLAAGACTFVFCVFAWYVELHLMLLSVDFPINVPLFDLSTTIPGASDLAKRKKESAEEQV